eukprot:11910568-Karenia_brevis.AAC.1
MAMSKADVTKMLNDLKSEAAKYGLVLHMGKTKILTTSSSTRCTSVSIGSEQAKILGLSEAERYLGRKLCAMNAHETEVKHRIASGWAAFAKYKHALCAKACPLHLRIKLFDSVVTPAVMYGCAAWTMSAELFKQLRTARRKMLRKLHGARKRVDEPWQEYWTRATHTIEDFAASCGSTPWEVAQRKKKWQFARRVATDDVNKWSFRLLLWRPWFRVAAKRDVGRPQTRWDDSIRQVAGESWITHAADQELWKILEPEFVH